MDESKHYLRLGLFVLVTLRRVAAVLFFLGGRRCSSRRFTFETYFNESVAGLDLGAPVRFRGVPLGQVTEIMLSITAYESGRPAEQAQEVHRRPRQGFQSKDRIQAHRP